MLFTKESHRIYVSSLQHISFHHLYYPHTCLAHLFHPPRSRSPISAIQSVFECAVVLLGSADVSWRAVRHATQDDNFCVRLAAVCVPALTQAVVSTLADKLEVIIIALIVNWRLRKLFRKISPLYYSINGKNWYTCTLIFTVSGIFNEAFFQPCFSLGWNHSQ